MKYLILVLFLSSCSVFEDDPKPGEYWDWNDRSFDKEPDDLILSVNNGMVLYRHYGNYEYGQRVWEYKIFHRKHVDLWKDKK